MYYSVFLNYGSFRISKKSYFHLYTLNFIPLTHIYRSIAFGMPEEESPDNVEYHTI